ncbi:MAG: GrpB family protein [Actinobacteria bacterium]|nr:GrpB family protein [Actinomycetota bacterium]
MTSDNDPVDVVTYDPSWPERFVAAERELRAALAFWVIDIEHIGSTAVPGLPAKPVIDIQVGVRSLGDSADIVVAVESLGYEYVPEFEDELRIGATSEDGLTAVARIKYTSSSAPTATGGTGTSRSGTGCGPTTMIGTATPPSKRH